MHGTNKFINKFMSNVKPFSTRSGYFPPRDFADGYGYGAAYGPRYEAGFVPQGRIVDPASLGVQRGEQWTEYIPVQ
jgi:hypothetical protein